MFLAEIWEVLKAQVKDDGNKFFRNLPLLSIWYVFLLYITCI